MKRYLTHSEWVYPRESLLPWPRSWETIAGSFEWGLLKSCCTGRMWAHAVQQGEVRKTYWYPMTSCHPILEEEGGPCHKVGEYWTRFHTPSCTLLCALDICEHKNIESWNTIQFQKRRGSFDRNSPDKFFTHHWRKNSFPIDKKALSGEKLCVRARCCVVWGRGLAENMYQEREQNKWPDLHKYLSMCSQK